MDFVPPFALRRRYRSPHLYTGRHTHFALIHTLMMHGNSSQELTFGYLSAVNSAEHGYFGGYLVISAVGRPLEFHCSAPVRPSRAQEILYGPTLQPYLLGEQIGGTLLSRAKTAPRLIVTDQRATLCLRDRIDMPFALLLPREHEMSGPDCQLAVRDHNLELPPGFIADREYVLELLNQLTAHVELAEPFDRIHEAIREAQRIGSRGQDAHGQAA